MGNVNGLPHAIPNHAAVTEIHGNDMTIPRYTEVAFCYPFNDTSYHLPKLSLAPALGSYMAGQWMYLRTYTGFDLTVVAADGDTIMDSPSITMPGGNLLILMYVSGNDWQIVANIAGGAIMSTEAMAKKMQELKSRASSASVSPINSVSLSSSRSGESGSAPDTPRSETTKNDNTRTMTRVNVLRRR